MFANSGLPLPSTMGCIISRYSSIMPRFVNCLHDAGAALNHEILAGLCLQLGNRFADVVAHHPRVVPFRRFMVVEKTILGRLFIPSVMTGSSDPAEGLS